jgi:hypothetical protein
MLFASDTAPDFQLVPVGKEFPNKPSANHKNGIRFMLKLSKVCAGGSAAVREIAGTSKAFLSGIEALYENYLEEKGENPDKLPVVVLEKVEPIKTGIGAKSSTNFQPIFRIVGWAPRGDLTFVPKATPLTAPEPQTPQGATPPSTGSIRAQPPSQEEAPDDDFG